VTPPAVTIDPGSWRKHKHKDKHGHGDHDDGGD
jgi:hypothetical protein